MNKILILSLIVFFTISILSTNVEAKRNAGEGCNKGLFAWFRGETCSKGLKCNTASSTILYSLGNKWDGICLSKETSDNIDNLLKRKTNSLLFFRND